MDTSLGYTFTTMATVGTDVLYAAGDAGAFAKSTDAGKTWTKVDLGASIDVWAIAFSSASEGFAVEASATFRKTSDGGATWTDVTGLPSGVSSWYRVEVAKDGTIFASDGGSVIAQRGRWADLETDKPRHGQHGAIRLRG